MEQKIMVSSDADSKHVFEMLMEYNRRYMHDFKDYNFHIEEEGKIIAGIVAWSVSDTMEVEYLRVADDHRKQGLGTKLLNHLEELARKDGLKRIRLYTFSFQAPEFYKQQGFTAQFVSPAFDDHTCTYYIKEL